MAWLQEKNYATTFTATPVSGGAPEAGLIVLRDGASACYWIAGSVPGPAMTVLLGHVLSRLQAEGVRYFDFVGANVPPVAEFKRHFGPKLVPYLRAHRTLRPDLRLLDALYHRLR